METQGSREMAGQSGWLTLVKLFAGAFVALMIVGYVAGYKGTKRATLASVYSELQIAPLTDTTGALAVHADAIERFGLLRAPAFADAARPPESDNGSAGEIRTGTTLIEARSK